MSDIYSMVGGEGLGITMCSSIFNGNKVRNDSDSSDFYGALCIDISPAGPLQNYFP